MLILSKKEAVCESNSESVTRFYMWKKALQNLTEADAAAIVSDAILEDCTHPELISLSAYPRRIIDSMMGLGVSLIALFYDIGWLEMIKDRLCPITDYLKVTRGERRGWDRLFYPASDHGIEQEYIKKVLKSSRLLSSLCAVPDHDAFCCSASIHELERAGHTGALRWIRRFENGVNTTGKPLVETLSRANMYWYEMNDTATADFVTSINPDKRLFVAKFDEPTFVNQRLTALKQINHTVEADVLHALLNSIVGLFFIEAIGFGRGLGALDIRPTSIRAMRLLNPALLTDQSKNEILSAFEPLRARAILSTDEELEQTDRIQFDHVVLNAFGIDAYYESIRRTLLTMQRVRHSARI